MALYLGSRPSKINLNNATYCLKLFTSIAILNGIQLLTSENYILRDSNGLYLTSKESE